MSLEDKTTILNQLGSCEEAGKTAGLEWKFRLSKAQKNSESE